MILVKMHKDGVLALCDENLVGKKIEHDLLQLDVTERFYKGEEKSKEEILTLAEDAATINIVGEEAVKFAIDNKIVDEGQIIYIGDVPHAQVFKIQ
ncbi:DUF424 family protein [Candidatus Woesearchaeota archaeon]|nr:MAG: DUF424 family protein [Candidatus Woesearchaeota archaeon]